MTMEKCSKCEGSLNKGRRYKSGVCNSCYAKQYRIDHPKSKPRPESLEGEEWKYIPNFEGLYELSSLCRVRNSKNGKIRRQYTNYKNVTSVALCKDNKVVRITPKKLLRTLFGIIENHVLPIEGEIWRDVIGEGFDGLYQVSDFARVKSLINNRLIKPVANTRGYLSVRFFKNNKYKLKRINRLVAKAFIPNPDNKPEVNHKDGNKTNNNVSNLEWATRKENMVHAFKNGLIKSPKGEKHHNARLRNFQVLEIKERLAKGHKQRDIAKDYGVCQYVITRINQNITYQV